VVSLFFALGSYIRPSVQPRALRGQLKELLQHVPRRRGVAESDRKRPTRRITAASLGKTPTTPERQPISRFPLRRHTGGSHQINDTARSGLLLGYHPDEYGRRVLARGKGNVGAPSRPPSTFDIEPTLRTEPKDRDSG
jgi:hypothetical protein